MNTMERAARRVAITSAIRRGGGGVVAIVAIAAPNQHGAGDTGGCHASASQRCATAHPPARPVVSSHKESLSLRAATTVRNMRTAAGPRFAG